MQTSLGSDTNSSSSIKHVLNVYSFEMLFAYCEHTKVMVNLPVNSFVEQHHTIFSIDVDCVFVGIPRMCM